MTSEVTLIGRALSSGAVEHATQAKKHARRRTVGLSMLRKLKSLLDVEQCVVGRR